MIEIWKDVPGYEGHYQVSNMGRIKSLERTFVRNNGKSDHAVFRTKERILKNQTQTQGYSQIVLSKDGIRKTFRINVLVAKLFVENPLKKSYVNHIDGNKKNNQASNLEWVTAKENIVHAYKHGLLDHYKRKVLQLDESNNVLNRFDSLKDAAEYVGGNKCGICEACRGRRKHSYGYKWKYE